jgi:CBS domain-containing protein
MAISGTIGTLLHHKGSDVWTIPSCATVFEAIQLLARKNIGALPVVDGSRLIGIFSERDYTRKVALEGKTSQKTLVREIISTNITTVTPHHTIEDCMRVMTEKRVRHLPVLDDNGQMVGVVSIGDMVNWIISAQNATITQMENYLAGR